LVALLAGLPGSIDVELALEGFELPPLGLVPLGCIVYDDPAGPRCDRIPAGISLKRSGLIWQI
jgi:hypothetical protein